MTILLSIFISAPLYPQETEIQSSINKIKSLDLQIKQAESYRVLAEGSGIKLQSRISDDGKPVDTDELNRVFRDLGVLALAKRSFNNDSISIDALGAFQNELVDKGKRQEYERLFSEYNNYQIDFRFYNKELLNGLSAMRNADGIFIIAKNGYYYHMIGNAEYWAPTSTIGIVKDPISDKRTQSILCFDATKLYSDEWGAYLNTRDKKYELHKCVSEFIAQNVGPGIDHLLSIKRQQIERPLCILAIRMERWREDYKTTIKRLVTFGVPLPENRKNDFEEVQKAANSYSMSLNSLYDSYIQQKTTAKGIYSLLKLITIDKAKVIKNARNDLQSIRSNLPKEIIDAISPEFEKISETAYLSSKPLNGQQYFALFGLLDDRYLTSAVLNANSDTNKLPIGQADPKQLYDALTHFGYTIPTVGEINELLKVDNTMLVNVFRRQVGQKSLDLMTTDNRRITGLISGDIILLLNEIGEPQYFRVQSKSETAWGMTQITLALQNVNINSFNNPCINIRLKKAKL